MQYQVSGLLLQYCCLEISNTKNIGTSKVYVLPVGACQMGVAAQIKRRRASNESLVVKYVIKLMSRKNSIHSRGGARGERHKEAWLKINQL